MKVLNTKLTMLHGNSFNTATKNKEINFTNILLKGYRNTSEVEQKKEPFRKSVGRKYTLSIKSNTILKLNNENKLSKLDKEVISAISNTTNSNPLKIVYVKNINSKAQIEIYNDHNKKLNLDKTTLKGLVSELFSISSEYQKDDNIKVTGSGISEIKNQINNLLQKTEQPEWYLNINNLERSDNSLEIRASFKPQSSHLNKKNITNQKEKSVKDSNSKDNKRYEDIELNNNDLNYLHFVLNKISSENLREFKISLTKLTSEPFKNKTLSLNNSNNQLTKQLENILNKMASLQRKNSNYKIELIPDNKNTNIVTIKMKSLREENISHLKYKQIKRTNKTHYVEKKPHLNNNIDASNNVKDKASIIEQTITNPSSKKKNEEQKLLLVTNQKEGIAQTKAKTNPLPLNDLNIEEIFFHTHNIQKLEKKSSNRMPSNYFQISQMKNQSSNDVFQKIYNKRFNKNNNHSHLNNTQSIISTNKNSCKNLIKDYCTELEKYSTKDTNILNIEKKKEDPNIVSQSYKEDSLNHIDYFTKKVAPEEAKQNFKEDLINSLKEKLIEISKNTLPKEQAKTSSLILKINPKQLGKIKIELKLTKEFYSIKLATSNPETKSIIEEYSDKLLKNLNDKGVNVSQLTISDLKENNSNSKLEHNALLHQEEQGHQNLSEQQQQSQNRWRAEHKLLKQLGQKNNFSTKEFLAHYNRERK